MVFPVAPRAQARTVSADGVEANYSQQPSDNGICVESPTLSIRRDEELLFDGPVVSQLGLCQPADRFEVRDLDQDDEPEVVIDFYSGGAHCCWFTQVYRYDAGQQYQMQEQDWGNHTPTLEDLDEDGQPEFVGQDDRFAYQFASYAGSAYPPRILRYQGESGFVDVTRQYPERVYDWAYGLWQRYEQTRDQNGEVRSVLAAYLASKYLIGEAEDGWQRVQTVYQQSDRRQFLTELAAFLQETGYAAAPDPTDSLAASGSASPDSGSCTADSAATALELPLSCEGNLVAGDSILPTDGSLYDEYKFTAQAGDIISIRLESEAFDPYLFLVGPQGELIAQNDDATDSDLAARLEITLPQTGDYRAIANSYDSTGRGAYQLTIQRQSAPEGDL